jgi:16S rRNA (guanine527-N7)-methyltransferase
MKGEKAQMELSESELAIPELGGKLSAQIPVVLPGDHTARCLIVVQKVSSTPKAYPRQTHEIIKSPLNLSFK